MPANKLFVLATVGTDHHPFDRFVDWLDTWQRQNTEYEVFIQRGSTNRVPQARSAQWVDRGELEAMMHRADAVVCHGGPSTIMEARRAGVLPVVIPRDPARGEHVDGHQLRFTEFMSAKGVILPARSEDELAERLGHVVHRNVGCVTQGVPSETLDRISAVIDNVMARPARPTLSRWSRCS